MLVTGAMILAGAWFAYRALRRKAVLIPTALLGLGCVGVGVFPQLWALLGSVALAATAMGVLFLEWAPVAALGEGGIERWIVYPNRPVAGRLRQLPAGGSGRPARWMKRGS
jgi:hypothetical protein